MSISFRTVVVALLASVTLGTGSVRPAHAQEVPTVRLPEVRLGSLRETMRGITVDSGNAGFGDLMSGLTALDVATMPLGSPTGGVVFRFEDPTSPARRSTTFTPLLLDRAATSGKGTLTFGFNITPVSYDTVSGLSMGNLPVATFQGPDPIVTSTTMDLDIQALTTTAFATVGLSDKLDVSVGVPIVGVTLNGSQVQREAAVGGAIFPINASSVGVGDMAIVGKYRVLQGSDHRSGLTAHATLRAPTGSKDDLRGIGLWRTMVAGTGSVRLGRLSLHGTGGYEFWSDSYALSNTFPGNIVETWTLRDQLQFGGGMEFEASRALTLTFEGIRRRIGDTNGQLDLRTVPAPGRSVGIASGQLLAVGPGALEKTVIVPGITVSIEENVLLSFRMMISVDDTGLRDEFTPMLTFSWAQCAEC